MEELLTTLLLELLALAVQATVVWALNRRTATTGGACGLGVGDSPS